MTVDAALAEVLRLYPADCRPGRIEPLAAAGGFSGARFWRLSCPRGLLCVRRWPPEHPTRDRLDWIHAVLRHVDRVGFHLVPVPIQTTAGSGFVPQGSKAQGQPSLGFPPPGSSFVSHAGALWELSPWMPGTPDDTLPTLRPRLEAAMIALAEFHVAAESFPLQPPQQAVSPGILQRREKLRGLLAGGIERLAAAIEPGVWPQGAAFARRIVDLFSRAATRVVPLLEFAAEVEVPIVPCLRDIWSDHVLFDGDRVTGLVDFGAMKPDSLAGDVARLLGSLAGDERLAWKQGVAAFHRIRPLSHAELNLIDAFDRSTVLMAGLNWIEWIYLERRSFENLPVIAQRLGATLARLEHLASLGRDADPR